MERRQRRVAMDAGEALTEAAQRAHLGGAVGELAHTRRRQRPECRPGAGDQAVAPTRPLLLEAGGLGAQHEVGKVDAPLVGRQVGALGLGAEIAQEALFDDLAVVVPVDAVHLHRVRLVDEIEQGRKRLAEVHAAAAAVADVEYPGEFGIHGVAVVEVGALPVDGLEPRRFETTFSDGTNLPCCSALLGVARRCSALLGVARRCSALLGVARRCSALLGVARRCSALLGVARRCSAASSTLTAGRRAEREGPRSSKALHRTIARLGRAGPTPSRRALSGTGWHGTARPWRASRTSRRSRRSLHRARSSPCPGACPCTRRSHRRWRP